MVKSSTESRNIIKKLINNYSSTTISCGENKERKALEEKLVELNKNATENAELIACTTEQLAHLPPNTACVQSTSITNIVNKNHSEITKNFEKRVECIKKVMVSKKNIQKLVQKLSELKVNKTENHTKIVDIRKEIKKEKTEIRN